MQNHKLRDVIVKPTSTGDLQKMLQEITLKHYDSAPGEMKSKEADYIMERKRDIRERCVNEYSGRITRCSSADSISENYRRLSSMIYHQKMDVRCYFR